MAKTISPEQFQSELHKILEEYGEDVANGTREAVAKIAQKGAQAVRSNSSGSFGGSGNGIHARTPLSVSFHVPPLSIMKSPL